MIRVVIKIGINEIVEIEGYHSEIEVNMDRIIGEDYSMLIHKDMTLVETILEKCIITQVKISEVDIEVIIEITTLEEVEVGLGKDNIQNLKYFSCTEHVRLLKTSFQALLSSSSGLRTTK